MRTLSVVLWVLAALASILWVLVYLWAFGMACGFVTSGTLGQCGPRMPWTLRGEDLRFLVLFPGFVVSALVASAWLAWRERGGLAMAALGIGAFALVFFLGGLGMV